MAQPMRVVSPGPSQPPPNGHLPVTDSSFHADDINPNINIHLQTDNSQPVDLLQDSISPEGRSAAAMSPELCSPTPYDYPGTRNTLSPSMGIDYKSSIDDDQSSIASYNSNASAANHYGDTLSRMPQSKVKIPASILKTSKNHESYHYPTVSSCHQPPKQYVKQPRSSSRQSKHSPSPITVENPAQYASLNAASLCNVGNKYYDTRCCPSQGSAGKKATSFKHPFISTKF